MRQVVVQETGDGRWVVESEHGTVKTLPEGVVYNDDRPKVWIKVSEITQDVNLVRSSDEAVNPKQPKGVVTLSTMAGNKDA